jgi:hypothetical protein
MAEFIFIRIHFKRYFYYLYPFKVALWVLEWPAIIEASLLTFTYLECTFESAIRYVGGHRHNGCLSQLCKLPIHNLTS